MKPYVALLTVLACLSNAVQADWTGPGAVRNQRALGKTQVLPASENARGTARNGNYAALAPRVSAKIPAATAARLSGPCRLDSPNFSGVAAAGCLPRGCSDSFGSEARRNVAYILADSALPGAETQHMGLRGPGAGRRYSKALSPTAFAGTSCGSGFGNQQPLPAPAPVPGAALLGALGLVGAARIRRRVA
jgi:hypothetical protein